MRCQGELDGALAWERVDKVAWGCVRVGSEAVVGLGFGLVTWRQERNTEAHE